MDGFVIMVHALVLLAKIVAYHKFLFVVMQHEVQVQSLCLVSYILLINHKINLLIQNTLTL